jgi:hypothetical protein
VWKDSRTSDRDRKRMVRWLLEEVSVLRQADVITAHVRFKGGVSQTITVAVGRGRCSEPSLVALIDQLLETSTDAEVAQQLNEGGVAYLRRETLYCRPRGVLTTLSPVERSWHPVRRARDAHSFGSSVGLWSVSANAHGLGTGGAASHVSDQ